MLGNHSENVSINHDMRDDRVKSLLSDIAHLNTDGRHDGQLTQANREIFSQENVEKPITMKEPVSPRFKHMPVSLYKNLKHASVIKVPHQTYFGE